MVEPEDYGESLGDYRRLKDKQRGEKVFAKSELVRAGKNPKRYPGVCALCSTGFGSTGHGDFWESIFRGVVGSEASEEEVAETVM